MKLIFACVRRHLGLFFAALFFLSVEAGADLMQPTLMSAIVDRGVKNADASQILHCGLMMLGVAVVGAFGAVMRNFLAGYTSQLISRELRGELYRKIQSLSLENIDRLQPAAVITRITNDVTQIQDFINGCMRILVKAPLTCIGAIVLIVLRSREQAPVLLAIIAIAAALTFANMKVGYPRFGVMQRKMDGLNAASREFLSAVRVVKAFGAEAREERRFEAASADLAGASTSAMRVMAYFMPLINLTVNFGVVAILWRVSAVERPDVGRLMASLNYMTQILYSVAFFSAILNRAARALASSRRIGEIFAEKTAQIPAAAPQPLDGRVGVHFEHVSFAYAGAARRALEDVTFHVEQGETLGVIGPTGAGKSTLVALLPRFYDATGGTVCVGGVDVTRADEKELREFVAVVPQKALLFSGTVRENLLWGRDLASDDEIARVCRTAAVDEILTKLPDGLETVLGQGGVNLSGGQKQRLTLARALLRRPRVLVLDDCTSALDAATEARVLAALRTELRGTTVFLISQRVAAVRSADRILCLEHGAVRGLGSHEDLLRSCDFYRVVYDSQIGGGANG